MYDNTSFCLVTKYHLYSTYWFKTSPPSLPVTVKTAALWLREDEKDE